MSNCFSLTKKGENAPCPLVKIDEEICKYLNVPIDPVKYHASWYDIIGWELAMGRDWPTIKRQMQTESLTAETDGGRMFWARQYQIVEFLERNYVPDSWVQIGK